MRVHFDVLVIPYLQVHNDALVITQTRCMRSATRDTCDFAFM